MNVETSMHAIAFITPGPTEWLFISAIVLVLFGARRLPELARGLGQGLNEFRKARDDFKPSSQRPELVPVPFPSPANSKATSPSGEARFPEVRADVVKT